MLLHVQRHAQAPACMWRLQTAALASAPTWCHLTPRRMLLRSGMVGYRFNTVGVSDAISMGTDGMSFSLQSRDLIADSIETIMGAQW